ncbi:phosphoserine phosphatase SerB [Methanobacterium sp. ACI-7]|uniref:phosphoserine phosphatase SerB n=1 Tax=unclassified Methanobacterium TaxID=2627676 RepID=UPI0039C2DE86
MIKLIAFDLDNVLIDGEAIDEIGKITGTQNEIAEITQKAMEGEIDFETSLKERVALLKGTAVDDIKNVILDIPLMEGAKEAIAELKKRGYKIATISGSFEVITNRLKDELDLDYTFSNKLHEEDGALTGEVSGPLVSGSKADVLNDIIKMENISAEECAAVGDGANDVSMIEMVKLGIAFNAKPVVKDIADVIIEKRDLRELLPLFEVDVDTKKEAAKEETNLSFDELLAQKREYESKLSEHTKERDDLNEEARSQRQVRDDLNASIKENLSKAIEYRDKRDKTNEEVKKYKKLRDETNNKLKTMEWESGRRDIVNIEKEIKRIDKTIETKVLDIRKENELIKRVQDLSKQLQEMNEDEQVKKEALELKELSESYHLKVVEFSDEAQSTHEKMLEYFQKIDGIRTKADEAHNKFIEIKNAASEKHEEVKDTLGQIRKINKRLDKVRSKKRGFESEASNKKNKKEKEHAMDIYQKFKDGKKLNTDELLLLQKHNVI